MAAAMLTKASEPLSPLSSSQSQIIDDFTCNFCQKMLSNGYNLLRHQQDFHNDNLDIPCIVANCPKKFLTFTQRERHVRQSHKVRCRGCDERFTKEAELHEHTKKVHGGVTRTYNKRRNRMNKVDETTTSSTTKATFSASAASSPATSAPASPLSLSFSSSLSSMTLEPSSCSAPELLSFGPPRFNTINSNNRLMHAAPSTAAGDAPSPVPVQAPLAPSSVFFRSYQPTESAIDFDAAEVPDLANSDFYSNNYDTSNANVNAAISNNNNNNNLNNGSSGSSSFNTLSWDSLFNMSSDQLQLDSMSAVDQIKSELLLFSDILDSSNTGPAPNVSFSNDLFLSSLIC